MKTKNEIKKLHFLYQNYLKRLSFETRTTISGSEPLAKMDYAEELLAKDRSLSSYIYDLGIQIAPSLIKTL